MYRIDERIKRYILYIHLFLVSSVVCFILFFSGVGLVSAAGVTPEMNLIQTYSSVGGAPQYKDDDKDLIYKVNQADIVTFSITTAQPNLNYLWRAMEGSEVLSSSTQGNIFAWTVPPEQSAWEIEIEVTIKDFTGNITGRDYLSWSITTSDLITVQTGESIQDAIDNFPVEGGIVELGEGTFIIDSTLWINKNNIILKGAGMYSTTIQHLTGDNLINVTIWKGPLEEWQRLYLNNQWAPPDPPEGIYINNITIKDLHLLGGSVKDKWGALTFEANNITFSNVWFSKHIMSSVYSGYHRGMNILNSLFTEGNSIFLDIVENGTISGNTIINPGTHGINLDTGGNNYVISDNNITSCTNVGIRLYSGSNRNSITNNIIDECGAGIMILNSLDNYVDGNAISSSTDTGIYIYSVGTTNDNSIRNNTIINNLIYDSVNSGIYNLVYGGVAQHPINATIISNVILSNGGDGIYNPFSQPTIAKNNIIVDNQGYGINGTNVDSTYNNIYNNTLGDYNGISAGTGDISSDPLFADSTNYDFHLKSQAGRYDPTTSTWVIDSVTSPCIDAGDPIDDYSNEPSPNGDRINMGAYGNTFEASKSYDSGENEQEGEVPENITIYPNPYITGKGYRERISFTNLPKEAIIRIYTLSGELIKTIKHKDTADGSSKDWDISGLSGGVYMYTIISKSYKKTGKISLIK